MELMEDGKNATILDKALEVVKRYDPDTYQRMQSSDWMLTASAHQADQVGAFGMTMSIPELFDTQPIVDINLPLVAEWADDNDVRRVLFLADVLVHEFKHTHQGTPPGPESEIPAFRTGSAFAEKLPKPDGQLIKELSDNTEQLYE